MPNVFKYSPGGSGPGTLKKGGFLIGNNTADYGGTYYTGITPATGGYTIYLNKATQGPSIFTAANDSVLIDLTNKHIAGNPEAPTGYTGAAQCLEYFAGQTDKVCVNRDYEEIVIDGLALNLDAGFTPSYPKGGTSCVDVSTNSFPGSLINGTSYNSGNGGNVVFDGSDDYIRFNSFSQVNVSSWTCQVFAKTASPGSEGYVFGWRGSSSLVTIGTWAGSWISHCSATSVEWINGPSTSQNVWTCITASYDNGIQRIYSNGQLYGSRSASFANPSSYIDLGAIGGSFNFNGSLAICLFYNRALTATEVLQNFNALKGRFGL